MTRTNKIMNKYDDAKGIYIHIPFCVQKCIYCDFNSSAGCTKTEIESYFDDLNKEADIFLKSSETAHNDPGKAHSCDGSADAAGKNAPIFDTIFIGGGTPTSVDSRYIRDLMGRFNILEDAEVTIEANPGTLTPKKLADYRDCGINRISMGVQSFQDDELAFLGRIHSAEEACRSFEMARESGFDNINIDLIFGYPGHTMESWKKTLDKVLELAPEHISFYSLQIEEGTKMYQLFRDGDVDQIPDELNREMYHYAVKTLKASGYEHYEISNAARPGYQCRHNLKYWSMTPYIGLGAGAHSYMSGCRFYNPDSLSEYHETVKRKAETASSYRDGGAIGCDRDDVIREVMSSGTDVFENEIEDEITDYLFTGLRRICGIELEDFRNRFGIDFFEKYEEKIRGFIDEGFVDETDGWLRFTEKGLDITNYILTELM